MFGLLGLLQRLAHGRRIGRADGDAVDALGDQVEDDLDLLLAAAMLARADILALELAAELALGLHAAVAGLVEERVVHVLRHQREGELLRAGGGHAAECAEHGRRGGADQVASS